MPHGSELSESRTGEFEVRLSSVIALFGIKDRIKLVFLIGIQISLSLLDLLGVALVGVIGALSVRGIQSQSPGDRVGKLLDFLSLSDNSLQHQVTFLGGIAALALIGRTILSVYLTKRSLLFLSRRAAILTSDLLRGSLDLNLSEFKAKSSQEYLFALTSGVNTVVLGIVASVVNTISDVSLLLVLSTGLFLVDTNIALASIALFGIVALVLYKLLHKRALILGEKDAEEQILSNMKILEVFEAYREYSVKNRKYFAFKQIQDSRFRLASITAERSFMPNISKYVFESFLVVGAISICAIQFSTQDASRAVGTLAVFLAAGTRITPAIMRIQQNALMLKGSFGPARKTLEVVQRIGRTNGISQDLRPMVIEHGGFEGSLLVANLSFGYPNAPEPAIKGLSISIKPGEQLAIIGPSGSGKSTLADLILGLHEPSEGEIRISGETPSSAITKWPGAIAYVPQTVHILNASVRDNICLGYEADQVDDLLVWNAVRASHLDEFVLSLEAGLDTVIGDGGQGLSGGQRQRIGIARALLTQPRLILFDEATSSLDAKTEKSITETLKKLKGQTTIIVIAHRLTSIEGSDLLLILENGEVRDYGRMTELVRHHPELKSLSESEA